MSKLIPEQSMAKMIQNAYDVMYERKEDHPPVVKLFLGNATWLLSEIDPFYPDIAYGLCDLGFGEPELGTVSITELETIKHPILGGAQVDKHFTPTHPMSVYARAARMCQQITDEPQELEKALSLVKQSENKL